VGSFHFGEPLMLELGGCLYFYDNEGSNEQSQKVFYTAVGIDNRFILHKSFKIST